MRTAVSRLLPLCLTPVRAFLCPPTPLYSPAEVEIAIEDRATARRSKAVNKPPPGHVHPQRGPPRSAPPTNHRYDPSPYGRSGAAGTAAGHPYTAGPGYSRTDPGPRDEDRSFGSAGRATHPYAARAALSRPAPLPPHAHSFSVPPPVPGGFAGHPPGVARPPHHPGPPQGDSRVRAGAAPPRGPHAAGAPERRPPDSGAQSMPEPEDGIVCRVFVPDPALYDFADAVVGRLGDAGVSAAAELAEGASFRDIHSRAHRAGARFLVTVDAVGAPEGKVSVTSMLPLQSGAAVRERELALPAAVALVRSEDANLRRRGATAPGGRPAAPPPAAAPADRAPAPTFTGGWGAMASAEGDPPHPSAPHAQFRAPLLAARAMGPGPASASASRYPPHHDRPVQVQVQVPAPAQAALHPSAMRAHGAYAAYPAPQSATAVPRGLGMHHTLQTAPQGHPQPKNQPPGGTMPISGMLSRLAAVTQRVRQSQGSAPPAGAYEPAMPYEQVAPTFHGPPHAYGAAQQQMVGGILAQHHRHPASAPWSHAEHSFAVAGTSHPSSVLAPPGYHGNRAGGGPDSASTGWGAVDDTGWGAPPGAPPGGAGVPRG